MKTTHPQPKKARRGDALPTFVDVDNLSTQLWIRHDSFKLHDISSKQPRVIFDRGKKLREWEESRQLV